ncbi:MAG: tetratricopeptide repeat protein [Aquaticitalea sp.]
MINEALIEKYFSKHLSENERIEFDRLYTTDFEFKKEVDFLNNVQCVSEAEDDAHFKKQLAGFESEFPEEKKSGFGKWLKPLTAIAALFLIALTVNFFMNGDINKDNLYATYFEPSKNVSAPIVRSDADENLLNDAFMAYSDGNYQKAIPLFETIYATTKNSELLFYEGNALLALGKTNEAIEKFEEHLQYSDMLTNRSHWYLALAYLKIKDSKTAKLQLKTLLKSDETFKKEEATSLLKKMG